MHTDNCFGEALQLETLPPKQNLLPRDNCALVDELLVIDKHVSLIFFTQVDTTQNHWLPNVIAARQKCERLQANNT